jgi:hypothetical protein
MKKTILFLFTAFSLTSCYNRIADLTLVSNRNYDKSADYVLLQPNVEAKVKTKKGDPLDNAVDEATNKVAGGDFLKNVKIWVSWSGKKIKIIGDVWGVQSNAGFKQNSATSWKVGDNVQIKTIKGAESGVLVDISDPKFATVKLNSTGESKKVAYDKLLKN